MAPKLDYKSPAEPTQRRSFATLVVDAVVGSSTIVAGLAYCLFVSLIRWCEPPERPMNLIPVGWLRITHGRQAARKRWPDVYRSI